MFSTLTLQPYDLAQGACSFYKKKIPRRPVVVLPRAHARKKELKSCRPGGDKTKKQVGNDAGRRAGPRD